MNPRPYLFISFTVLLFGLFLYHPALKAEDNDYMSSLVGLVMDSDNVDETEDDSLDEEIINDVLAYLGNVYSDHDFYESGGWAKTSPLSLSRNQRKLNSVYTPSNKNKYGQTFVMANRGTYIPKAQELPGFLTRDFYLPIRGRLTSKFGYRPKFGRMHKGIDVSLHLGDTVRNALPGVVSKVAYEEKGYGNYVVVTHAGGYETRYAHMTRCIVSPGQSVRAGQAVGLGGSTGNSTGPHLHFEIRYKGEALDPLKCFGLGEVYH